MTESRAIVVPPGDTSMLAERLVTLLQDRPLRRRMGEAGRARAAQFDIRHAVRRMEQVYEELLDMSRSRVALDIRPFAEHDTAAVLSLLEASLGGGPAGERSPAFFRWKHLENPFGRSYMLVAEADDRIVGFRAFMRWRFDLGGEPVRAVRAVDTATHPDHQGRGIFRQLTTTALEDLRSEADLIFNTPNDKSLPGYLKMGWRKVEEVPIRVRVRRPVRFLRHMRSRRDLAASETCDGELRRRAVGRRAVGRRGSDRGETETANAWPRCETRRTCVGATRMLRSLPYRVAVERGRRRPPRGGRLPGPAARTPPGGHGG